jgi:homoserine O-succinyltransferase
VLTESAGAGVDLFVKNKKKSLFVHFQGHPEYLTDTLFKEYRRDVKRFLRRERDKYPLLPEGYFDNSSRALFDAFRERAILERREEMMERFPVPTIIQNLENSWGASSVGVYGNWLEYLTSRRVAVAVSRPLTKASYS